jgi:hypothetical protein
VARQVLSRVAPELDPVSSQSTPTPQLKRPGAHRSDTARRPIAEMKHLADTVRSALHSHE